MGNLRARSANEKALKRKAILSAAEKLLEKRDGQFPTATEIAKHAKVSKGTVYVYFKTKEEIYLVLFLTKLQEWAKDVSRLLQRIENPDIKSAANALAQYPNKNPMLMVLGGTLHGVLEKNAPFESILEMKIQVAALVEECGTLLNKYFPWLPPEQGAKFMLTAYTLFNGLFQSASSSPRLKKELTTRSIDIFRVDLESDMINAAIILLEGLHVVLSNE